MEQMDDLQKRYLKLLSEKYPTIASASTEIINLSATCRKERSMLSVIFMEKPISFSMC